MRQNENARDGEATPRRAKERAKAGELCGGYVPASDNTTPRGVGQVTISGFLSRGAVNAVTLRQLERVTGLDGRTVRRLIERERREGIPILSDCSDGYYLPICEMERDRCVQSLRHRAGEILRTADALARAEIEEV